jgi:hypothetical protein
LCVSQIGPFKEQVWASSEPKIKSPLLEGEYVDRRMTYFSDEKDIKVKRAELLKSERISEGEHLGRVDNVGVFQGFWATAIES